MCKSKTCCPAYVVLLYTVMGYSHKRICEVTGYKSSSVGNIISRRIGSRAERGHIVRERWVQVDSPHKAVSDALMPQIIELHEQGKSYREIAETLGVGRDAVCKRVVKLGLGGGKGSNSSAGGKAYAKKRRAACIKRFESVADKVELISYAKSDNITVRCVKCGREFMWTRDHWQMDVPCPECRKEAARTRWLEEQPKREQRKREQRKRKKLELEQQREAAREWRLSVPLICSECGEPFYTEYETKRYCSDECKHRAKVRRKNRNARRNKKAVGRNPYKRRMRIKVTPETYDRRIRDVGFVYRKFHGVCCGCGCQTVRTSEYMPNRATLDHIIALNNYGTHTEDNVQLLCAECNSLKRDTGQMRLPIAV